MEHEYPWQAVFKQITAADPRTLAERINKAEILLFSRWQELASSPENGHEKQALQQSIKELGRIQTDKLGYPDWRKLGPM